MNLDEVRLKKAFGKRVGFLRRQAGLTQENLANKINELKGNEGSSSKQTVANMEAGAKGPSLKMIGLLADALRTTPASLFLFDSDGLGQQITELESIAETLNSDSTNLLLEIARSISKHQERS